MADPNSLITQKEVDYYYEYYALSDQFTNQQMDIDVADQKARAIILKKYKLKNDWQLPLAQLKSDDNFNRQSITVDDSYDPTLFYNLDQCMKGKMLRVLTSCS